ncbi:TenA family protein [Leekyejoonella antrihumi]|uniref:Aminopyrimidine aminohydrolase n=1 Tax=Leekyejoonella antrihumi TaxID=1660198 RepID=A0A563E9Q1_9MICO|nr:TenA family protein [Leekyejoonella antrihumi]TWP38931.1 TenA family transcriptional regulator [Leekyejoonella antrihumi]
MTRTFTESLRLDNETTWSAAVQHRLVEELLDGSITDAVMAGYLIQDHRFLDSFLALLGSAVATADTFEARLILARFAGEVAGDENTYFERSFAALGVTDQIDERTPDTPATSGFKDLFRDAAESRDYAGALAVLVVTEWLYLDWARRAPSRARGFVHAEWIALHDNPGFAEFVAFLRRELDRLGSEHGDLTAGYFQRAVELELAFFDQAYDHPVGGAR